MHIQGLIGFRSRWIKSKWLNFIVSYCSPNLEVSPPLKQLFLGPHPSSKANLQTEPSCGRCRVECTTRNWRAYRQQAPWMWYHIYPPVICYTAIEALIYWFNLWNMVIFQFLRWFTRGYWALGFLAVCKRKPRFFIVNCQCVWAVFVYMHRSWWIIKYLTATSLMVRISVTIPKWTNCSIGVDWCRPCWFCRCV